MGATAPPAVPPHAHRHGHGPATRRRRVIEDAAPLFVHPPTGPARCGVVVLHGVHGLTDEVERRCRDLARSGFLAAAPYLYHETGGRVFGPGDLEAARTAMSRLAPHTLIADAAAALDHLQRRHRVPPSRTAVLGLGSGGHLAARVAAQVPVGAAVALHCGDGDGEDRALPGRPGLAAVPGTVHVPWFASPDEPAAWPAALRFLEVHLSR